MVFAKQSNHKVRQTPKLRILVLTSSTGGGHDARAFTFRAWVHKLHGDRIDVKIERLLENSSLLLKFGVELYNWIQKTAPFLHNLYWWVVEGFGALNNRLRIFGYSYFRKLILTYRPHIILSVHDSTNRGYFEAARKLLRRDSIVCATYCGEYTSGRGYSRHWVDPDVNLFCARTEEARAHALILGVPPQRTKLLQNFLPPEAFSKVLEGEGRKEFRKEILGLAAGKFTVLLAAGGEGANDHKKFLEILVRYQGNIQAVAICGGNAGAYSRLRAWKKRHAHFQFYLEGYSSQVHQLMQVSDAVVTRGGANTASEALFFGCPIIFHTLGGSMPQERLTMEYFLKLNAARLVANMDEFDDLIHDWMENSDDYQTCMKRLLALRSQDSPPTFVDELISLANETE